MAKPLVIPAEPVAKAGTVTYNSAYAGNIPNRYTNSSVIQYGKLVVGIIEFYTTGSATAVGDYKLFTLSGISMPAAATPGSCVQLNDFAAYDMEMPAIAVNKDGTITFHISSSRFLAGYAFVVSFNYLTA
ncbi:MAG: hypothetical protein LBV22_01555 [Mycoplasmataceae bacterium]|jgi:hypothetical protein|nr:hypothetical protein [Mycoplasmataceae bacterium]